MSNKMKAVVLEGPGVYGIKEVPVPLPGYKEVLVRIKAVAICGSDPKVFNGAFKGMWPPAYPFIAGHEFAGEVVEIGADVTEFKVGDRVAGEAHCGCGYCKNCKAGFYNLCLNYGKPQNGHRHYGFTSQGAYAQYNAYNVKALAKLPDNVSYEEGTMCDTAGTSYNGIQLSGVTAGGYSVVVGPGPIGLTAMMLAQSMGSKVIVIGRRERLAAAERLGADYVVNYEQEDLYKRVAEITQGAKADEVFECAGTEASVKQSLGVVKRGGKVVLLGLPTAMDMTLPIKSIIMDQVALLGSRANPNCSEQVLSMMSSGKLNVKDMITHTFPLENIKEAIDTFVGRIDGALKVVIKP